MPELKCTCGHWIYQPVDRDGLITCPHCGRQYRPMGLGYIEEGKVWVPKFG